MRRELIMRTGARINKFSRVASSNNAEKQWSIWGWRMVNKSMQRPQPLPAPRLYVYIRKPYNRSEFNVKDNAKTSATFR